MQKSSQGLVRREPSIDFRTARDANILGLSDPDVLAIAARDGRIPVSHDREAMPAHFSRFIADSNSARLLIVSKNAAIGQITEQILIVWAASDAAEWVNRIGYLPF
jgi:hypothetical protein